ncbi:hypothetical protein RHBI111906_12520 [Rhodothermus bifroesti]
MLIHRTLPKRQHRLCLQRPLIDNITQYLPLLNTQHSQPLNNQLRTSTHLQRIHIMRIRNTHPYRIGYPQKRYRVRQQRTYHLRLLPIKHKTRSLTQLH